MNPTNLLQGTNRCTAGLQCKDFSVCSHIHHFHMYECLLSHFGHVWTPCNTMYCGHSGSSVPGILQQEPWRGLPCPPPGGLPDPGIKAASAAASPALQVDSFLLSHWGSSHHYCTVLNLCRCTFPSGVTFGFREKLSLTFLMIQVN